MNDVAIPREAPPPDPARCPLCGNANDCRLCSADAFKGSCWCAAQGFPEELLARVPEACRNQACICRACVMEALRQRPAPQSAPGDFDLDPSTGLMVFTADYLRRRGYCCDSGCRHCPWTTTNEPGASMEGVRNHSAAACGLVVGLLGLVLCGNGRAGTVTETFDADPATSGWSVSGSSGLFQWDSVAKDLEVTWDSSKPHSFFAHPLGMTLGERDGFAFGLDLRLDDVTGGVRPPWTGAMQVAFGLLDLDRAVREHYPRAAGRAFDLMEFNWFPEGEFPGFGVVDSTVSPAVFSSTGRVASSFTFPVALATGVTHRIRCTYLPAERTLVTWLVSDGTEVEVRPVRMPEDFGNLTLNAFAVINWTESDGPYDSLLAHGRVDNLFWELSDPSRVVIRMTSPGVVEFTSVNGWTYHLDAGGDLDSWSEISTEPGSGQAMVMSDPRDADFQTQFYRVRAHAE